MTRYNEDPADKQINNNKLKSMFNMGEPSTLPPALASERELATTAGEIKDDLKDQRQDPDDIIYTTIDRANRLLDKLELDIENAASARMFEVAATLINSVTQAANSIIGTGQHADELEYKSRLLELKERETAVKEALGTKGSKTVNNMIVTDRESLLKMISEDEPEKEVKEVNPKN